MAKTFTFTANVTAKLDVRHLKAGEYTLLIPVPDEIATEIGRVAIGWGGFEQRMDALIDMIFRCTGNEPIPNWRRLSFRKRKEIFRGLVTAYTDKVFPDETEIIRKIADRSADLHWRRNIVAHGYIAIYPKPDRDVPGQRDTGFVALGKHKGKDIRMPLEVESLQKLWHDIAHLGGALMASVARMGGGTHGLSPEIVVADRDFLREAPRGKFQILPIPHTPKPPPEPFQE